MSRLYHGNNLVLGKTADGKKIIWTEQQRRTHLYTTGRTRSGKSRFLQSLIRQDLEQHRIHKQGLLLLDPHGELYDGVLAYIAENRRLWNVPVVLIDLRKDDWIVAYNLLKGRQGVDPAVVATGFVEAITHAFGGANMNDTPRLARIARMFVQALFDTKRTLYDVLPLLDHANGALRTALLAELPWSNTRTLLEQFNQLSKKDFDTSVESFTNRMSPFLCNRVIGHMVGQPADLSFDFDWAIDAGAIVLVSLATERGKIASNDGRLFASLMLSDLWQVAKMRGKKGAGYAKPFAVYADEFQNFLTPTISQQLDQAAGFGIQFILAHQFPSQILDNGGDFGPAIYKSVMVNTLTKVVFQAPDQPIEREALVHALFGSAIDVHRIEHTVTSFQTVGHRDVRRVLRGGSDATGTTTTAGTTTGKGTSVSDTVASGLVTGEGMAETHVTSTGNTYSSGHVSSSGSMESSLSGTSIPDFVGMDTPMPVSTAIESMGYGSSWSDSDIDSQAESDSEADGVSTNQFQATNQSTAHQVGESTSTSEMHSVGKTVTSTNSWQEQITLEPILAERVSSIQLQSVESQVFEFGQRLAAQAPQHAYVRLPENRDPVMVKTLDCPEPVMTPVFINRIRHQLIKRMPCALPFSVAQQHLSALSAPEEPDPDEPLRIAAVSHRRVRGTVKEQV